MKVKVYLHREYEFGELEESYPQLSKQEIENLHGDTYEVELEYDTKTRKFKVIESNW